MSRPPRLDPELRHVDLYQPGGPHAHVCALQTSSRGELHDAPLRDGGVVGAVHWLCTASSMARARSSSGRACWFALPRHVASRCPTVTIQPPYPTRLSRATRTRTEPQDPCQSQTPHPARPAAILDTHCPAVSARCGPARPGSLHRPSCAAAGDLDRPAACLELERGHLDAAEPFAASSMRRWEGRGRSRTQSAIVLATIHVRAGEPRGLQLAHGAVTSAGKLTSVRARQRLVPLAEALEARRGSDAEQLARMARQVAATRV